MLASTTSPPNVNMTVSVSLCVSLYKYVLTAFRIVVMLKNEGVAIEMLILLVCVLNSIHFD